MYETEIRDLGFKDKLFVVRPNSAFGVTWKNEGSVAVQKKPAEKEPQVKTKAKLYEKPKGHKSLKSSPKRRAHDEVSEAVRTVGKPGKPIDKAKEKKKGCALEKSSRWAQEEDVRLHRAVQIHTGQNWRRITSLLFGWL